MLDFFAIIVTVVQIEHVVFEKCAVPSFRAAFFHSRNADYTNRTVLVAAANCTFVNWVKKGWNSYRTADFRQPPRPALFIFSGSSFSGAKERAQRSESTCGALMELAGSFMSSRSLRIISLAFWILAEAEWSIRWTTLRIFLLFIFPSILDFFWKHMLSTGTMCPLYFSIIQLEDKKALFSKKTGELYCFFLWL